MEYLKFNCFDLSEQNMVFYEIYRILLQNSEELKVIYNSLDDDIKHDEEFLEAINSTKIVAAEVMSVSKMLDMITDIYYLTENAVLKIAENLPTITTSKQYNGNKGYNTSKVMVSEINYKNLITEDWVSELIYESTNKQRGL